MKRIQINYKPLDKSVTLSPIGGSTVQQYNATVNEYVPDYTLVPLVVQPSVSITDPDGIIPAGIKNSSLTDINWYENKVDASTLIASSNVDYLIDRTSTDNKRGRITVKKNIPEVGLTLIFTAKFIDTRTGMGVPLQDAITLTSQSAVESSERLVETYPLGKRIYPTTGRKGLKIRCPLMNDAQKVGTAIYRWQQKKAGSYENITEGQSGITGVATDELWIPVGLICENVYFKTIVTNGDRIYEKEHVLSVGYEAFEVDIILPGNGQITPGVEQIVAKAKITTAAGVVSSPGDYFTLDWVDQNGNSLGSGESITIPSSKFATADFGIDLVVGYRKQSSEWYADFDTYPAATLTGEVTGTHLTVIGMAENHFDIIFPNNNSGFCYQFGSSSTVRAIIITSNTLFAVQKNNSGYKAFGATLQTPLSGRHTLSVTTNFNDTDTSQFVVKVDGVKINEKEYLPEYYDILSVRDNPFIEFASGAVLGNVGCKLISYACATIKTQFADRNLTISSVCTLVPSGATVEQLIKPL